MTAAGASSTRRRSRRRVKGRTRKTRAALVSDAYATGSALVALHLAGGISVLDGAYRRGSNSWFEASGMMERG